MASKGCLLGLALALAPALVAAEERTATADDKLQYADGPTACRALHEKNDRDLAEWKKTQPPTPYEYPHETYVLGAPWGGLTSAMAEEPDLLLATLLPHVGSQLRESSPVAIVSWPWSIPFGPAYTCSRHQGTFTVRDYRFHRLMIEPGLFTTAKGPGFFTRPGYRFLYHPSDWVVGVGAGFGTNIELAGKGEPQQRASLSPEAVIQFGHCCDASYFTFAIRYDHFFAGASADLISGSLGYTFF